jgi:hypothetical protein
MQSDRKKPDEPAGVPFEPERFEKTGVRQRALGLWLVACMHLCACGGGGWTM